MSSYRVIVLFEGYSKPIENGQTANCTCSLILGPKKIIVDTMTPWDGDRLKEALERYNVKPDEIDFVVSTHGHSDHVGNNNLFLKARHIVGQSISFKDVYFDHPFDEEPFFIDDNVHVIASPGHTLADVSVVVAADIGTVVVAGDLFENEDDLTDENIWKSAGSENEELQRRNRDRVIQIADYIVPGHGKMFKNPQRECK